MIDASDVTAVLLAAGLSSRFGAPNKLLAHLHGEPLALFAARTMASLGPARRIAVCNAQDAELPQMLAGCGFEIAINHRTEQGMASSLACAIDRLGATASPAVLICLADMPFIGADHLRALLARFDADRVPVVASRVNDIAMPPAVFAASHYDGLRSLTGDRGARALLTDALLVSASAHELADIDTPQDLERLQK